MSTSGKKKAYIASSRPADRLSKQVYDHLTEQLLTKLAPGDILNRRQVAADLGISVAPVLEAMVQLEADGLLQTLPRKGTHVRPIRIDDLRGQLLLREAIECQAARLYCGKAVADQAATLLELATRVDSATGDPLTLWRAEAEFHRTLVALARCDALTEVYNRVMRAKLFIALKFFLDAHPEEKRGNHRRLIKELQAADPDKAESAIRAHLRLGKPASLLTPS